MLIARIGRQFTQSLLVEDEGATAVEYGVMLAAIIAVIMIVVFTIGQDLLPGFQTVQDQL